MIRMTRSRHARKTAGLAEKYPPSEPCACAACLSFCSRPGWWSVQEAGAALKAGLAGRMMLEMAPGAAFGVLSPAFRGNEGAFARQDFTPNGCGFLKDGLCELHGSDLQPLECRFCHHERPGQGQRCHTSLEQDWATPAGQALVVEWARLTGFLDRLKAGGLG
ncbi:MAG: hypothetical protein AB9891_00805 [Anaerolineaceae bacterium]